jgi:hypothetical protein
MVLKRALITTMLLGLLGVIVISVGCKKSSESPVTTKCVTDNDCTLNCETRQSCCFMPDCGMCRTAMHVDEASAIRKYRTEHCSDSDRKNCPVVGACGPPQGPAMRAACRSGACVAETTDAMLQ